MRRIGWLKDLSPPSAGSHRFGHNDRVPSELAEMLGLKQAGVLSAHDEVSLTYRFQIGADFDITKLGQEALTSRGITGRIEGSELFVTVPRSAIHHRGPADDFVGVTEKDGFVR